MLDEELQDAMARICFIAGNRNLNWSLQRTWPTNAAHSLSMPQQPSYPGWSQSEHGGCSQSPPKTSAQMTLAALLEPVPTILFMSQDLPHWPFSIWTLWGHSVTTCWQPIRWTLWCHMRMIGKALLSGFWVCPERLCIVCLSLLLTQDPSHRRFLLCLTTSVATRRCRC